MLPAFPVPYGLVPQGFGQGGDTPAVFWGQFADTGDEQVASLVTALRRAP